MYLAEQIAVWIRSQTQPVTLDQIIARFAPVRTTRPRGAGAMEKARQAASRRRSEIRRAVGDTLRDRRVVLTDAGYVAGTTPPRRAQQPIIPTVFRMLRENPHRTLSENELFAALERSGITKTQFRNNMQVRICAQQIKREIVDGVRMFTLIENDAIGKPDTDSYEQWQQKTDRQKFDEAERTLSRLMGGQRFEDHPRARTTFLPARYDRASAVVPRGSTSSQCVEARL